MSFQFKWSKSYNFSVKLQETQIKINNCLNNLKRLREKLPLIEENHSISTIDTLKEMKYYNCCFLIHGHNDNVKLEVSRFIENDLSIKTIILHEQPNKGRTVIEKFKSFKS